MVTLAEVVHARDRLFTYLHPTPLEIAPGLGAGIWLKLENANQTHSFKVRGALNAVLSLDRTARSQGIVACSSGNHAQGVAYAAHSAGVRARIVMPSHTPRRKVNGVRRYSAEPILFGATYDEAEAEAHRIEQAEGLTFVSPYNDPHVVAGAGTIGLEILDTLPDVQRVIVSVSGGGLISGVGMAIKSRNPSIEVIGVTAVSTPALYNHFHDKDLPQEWETLAEALSGGIEAGSITLEMTKQYVDDVVLVDEDQIASAMRWMVDEHGWIVEGGGAVGIAAVQQGVIPADGRTTVIIVSGGNVDGTTLRQVLFGLR